MQHFSAHEIELLAQQRLRAMPCLTATVAGAMTLSAACVVLLAAAFAVQVRAGLEQFSELLIALFLLVSFYALYEGLRLHALRSLTCLDAAEAARLIKTAHEANCAYSESITEILERNGISMVGTLQRPLSAGSDTGFRPPSAVGEGVSSTPLGDRSESTIKEGGKVRGGGMGCGDGSAGGKGPGYKGIYLVLLCVMAFAVLNCTVLALGEERQPHAHTPSAAPSLAPTNASIISSMAHSSSSLPSFPLPTGFSAFVSSTLSSVHSQSWSYGTDTSSSGNNVACTLWVAIVTVRRALRLLTRP